MKEIDIKRTIKESFELFITLLYLPVCAAFILSQFSPLNYGEAFLLSSLFLALNILISIKYSERIIVTTYSLPLLAFVFFSLNNVPFDSIKAIFLTEGILLFAVTISNLREIIIKGIPRFIRISFIAGLGLKVMFMLSSTLIADFSVPSLFFLAIIIIFSSLSHLRIKEIFSIILIISIILGLSFSYVSLSSLQPPKFPILNLPSLSSISYYDAIGVVLALFFFSMFHGYEIEKTIEKKPFKKNEWLKTMSINSIINSVAGLNGSSLMPEVLPFSAKQKIVAYIAAFLFVILPFVFPSISLPNYIIYPIVFANALILASAITKIKEKKPPHILSSLLVFSFSALLDLHSALLIGLLSYIIYNIISENIKNINLSTIIITFLLLASHFKVI